MSTYNIDKLVDNSDSYIILSFMDMYVGYNKKPMFEEDNDMMAFMIGLANYRYNFMHFGPKNDGEKY